MLVVVVAGVGVALALVGADEDRARPPLAMLRGPRAEVEAKLQPLLRQVARRVEGLRGLDFRRVPRLAVMGEGRIAALGRRYARRERERANAPPWRLHHRRRLERASLKFDQLAGLLPPEFSLGPDTKGGLDRIAGAFDYRRNRIVLLRSLIQSRVQLTYTLAHELAHALEGEQFHLRLDTLTQPDEAASVHRAVVEGTATFVQDRYRRRYLHDDVPLAQRLEGMRSVIAAGPSAYAINAQAIFDYVDGALFVRRLYGRSGGWRLVNRALRTPPRRSTEILHPRSWPGSDRAEPVRLGIAPMLRDGWQRVGGAAAGEEQALVILLAGTIGTQAVAGASGWDGGRFAVWRPRAPDEDCSGGCTAGDVGAVAFRWRHQHDPQQFALAVPAYMTLGLLAEPVSDRMWELDDGYAALGTAPRASTLAFAPTPELASALSRRASTHASAYDVRDEAGDGPRTRHG